MAQFPPLFAGMAARMRRRRGDVGLPQAPYGAQISASAAMAHELRTPVACMTGFAELLLGSKLTEEQREHAGMIAQSGRQLLALIERQLGGAREAAEAACDPREVAQGCVRLLLPQASAKGLHLALWIDEAVPQQIVADASRLRQILLNLIGNAIKFTNAGGVDVELVMDRDTAAPMLRLAVIDSGIGIAPDQLGHIFQPYAQADASIAPRFGGSGLGLAISQRLATSIGGVFSVHTQPGVGSNFTLSLPVATNGMNLRAMGQSDAQPAPTHPLAGERVLVAEDDGISRRLLLALASTLGLEICLAATGEEVIEAVRAAKSAGRPFRAVLMDLHMPVMNGLETAVRLRALGHDAASLPIIALTASCEPCEIAACHEAGMQAHLSKPVTALALARELARCLPKEPAEPDVSDLLLPFPSGRTLQERYVERKEQLLANLRMALESKAAAVDWEALIGELHRISGVAGHFGEGNLGETARRLEARIKEATGADERQRELRRAWPFLMQVA